MNNLINLSTAEDLENYKYFYQQIPGILLPPFPFCINNDKEFFQAYLIIPFGQNPKHTTPIIAWVTEEDKIYSPEHFFEKKLENLWKFPEQTYRFITLYNDYNKQKVRLNKSITKEAKDDMPLACFKEDGSTEGPFTYINMETSYGKFIYNISIGNLNEVVKIIKNNEENIKIAYPCLNTIIDNIISVNDNLSSLEWFNENKINSIDDISAQKRNLASFEQVSDFFQKLFIKKNKENEIKYGKGILAIISKSFAYIPRN